MRPFFISTDYQISEKPNHLDNNRNNYGRTSFNGPLEPINDGPLDTSKKDFLTLLKETKKKSNVIAKNLSILASNSNDSMSHAFKKAQYKISNCSTHGVFREVVEGQIHKVGQALCKNKLCPNCQRVVSRKRRNKAEVFFNDNIDKLKEYTFYHLVLTLRHNPNLRNYDYVDEILYSFKNLRGTESKRKEYQKWKEFIEGGYYSVEVKEGKDSPHIHIHSIIMTKSDVSVSDMSFIQDNWKMITKDSNQIQLEPIFFLSDEYEEGAVEYVKKDGSKAWKIYYDSKTHSVDYLRSAFMESLKYTIKSDSILGSSKTNLNDDKRSLVYSLLTKKHRLFGRFGCLYNTKKNRELFTGLEKLAFNYKDLENVNDSNRILTDVETGEIYKDYETRLFVTGFSNVRTKEVTDDYTLYNVVDKSSIKYYFGDQLQKANITLTKTLIPPKGKDSLLNNSNLTESEKFT